VPSRLKLLMATACAVVALGAGASAAGAYDMDDIDPAGTSSLISSGKVSFGDAPQVRCNMTLRSSFRTSMDLSPGENLASITEVNIRNCEGGSVSGVLGLPWTIDYESVTGSLPNEVESILGSIEGFEMNLSVFGGFVNCLYSGLYDYEIILVILGPRIIIPWIRRIAYTGLLARFVRGSGLCPEEIEASGEFNVSPDQEAIISE
jgi:hypothetical protein